MCRRPYLLLTLAAGAVALTHAGLLGDPGPTSAALPNARVTEVNGRTSVTFRDELDPSDAAWLVARPRLGLVFVVATRAGTRVSPTDATLRLLRGVPVTHLALSGDFTDAGLAHLAGHKHLESLWLEGCPRVTGVGVAAALEGLPGLRSLGLTGVSLSARDAAVVFRLPLASLRLTGCTGEGVARQAIHGDASQS